MGSTLLETFSLPINDALRSLSTSAFFHSENTAWTRTGGWYAEQGARTADRVFRSSLRHILTLLSVFLVAQSHTTAHKDSPTARYRPSQITNPLPRTCCLRGRLILPYSPSSFSSSCLSPSTNLSPSNPRRQRYSPPSTSIQPCRRTSSIQSSTNSLPFANKRQGTP